MSFRANFRDSAQGKFTQSALSPGPMGRDLHAVGRLRWVLGGSQGRSDNTRRKPLAAGDAHRCWTGAMRTSENSAYAKFVLLVLQRFEASGCLLCVLVAGPM
jgi:hypothetical protein